LLNQSRSGPRQSDNEQGGTTRIAASLACGKEVSVKEPLDALRTALESLDVKRSIHAAQRVASRVVRESLGVPMALLECLPQGEVQLGFIGAATFVGREEPLHLSHLRISEEVVLEIGETPVGLRPARVHPQGLF